MSGRKIAGRHLTGSQTLDADVCIVGSGAGGAVLAAGLVARGLSVVVLEEGPDCTKADFDLQEGHAYPLLYQEQGMRATADLAITILQGRSVGGSTTVNWTTCFRVPTNILRHWADHHGVEGLDEATLAPHFEKVEARLGISVWPENLANENNRVLLQGGRALGWDVAPLKRNVRACVNSGYCGLGCPVDAKQSMHLTYLPDAVKKGLVLFSDVRAETIETAGDRATAVHGRALLTDGKPSPHGITVRAKVVVSSGGAINGPALLLRSGIHDGGLVGKRTFLHPVVAMAAFYDREIHPYYGAPQSIGSHHFIDRGERIGFFLETPPIHPMLAATAYAGFGVEHQAFLARLPHLGVLIGLCVDGLHPGDEGGTVSLRKDGRIRVDYPIGSRLEEAFHAASVAMARIQLAAGATEIRTLHREPVVIRREADLTRLDDAPWGALRHSIFTAHQMGGCPMGEDPHRSVVNSRLQHHRIHNLFVVDGSVFPTSLGVNPSETIYALADWAVEHVAAAV